MTADPDCIFCRIVAEQAPASFVARTATVSAFMDVNPITPGHLLVVANDHFVGLADTPPAVMTAIVELGQRCAAALRAGNFRADGINLILADGKAAMQEVDHVHLHVLPRYAGDSFRMRADREFNANRSELESAAATLGRALPAATAD